MKTLTNEEVSPLLNIAEQWRVAQKNRALYSKNVYITILVMNVEVY